MHLKWDGLHLFVVRPGDLIVAEGSLQLFYGHRMVRFTKCLEMNEKAFTL